MKERNYVFSLSRGRKGTLATKRQIIDSLVTFAKEKRVNTFTQKQYDAWNHRVLCSSQIAHRFGGWFKAMEAAGLNPMWNFTKNPGEMVELYKDCWEEHDDCPTEKTFALYLSRVDSKYNINIYRRYFGSLQRLSERIIDEQEKRISEKQLIAKWEPPGVPRVPISNSTRFKIMERDGFICRVCGRSAAEDHVTLNVDHWICLANGGTNEVSNLVTLCAPCNKAKGTKTLTLRGIPGNYTVQNG